MDDSIKDVLEAQELIQNILLYADVETRRSAHACMRKTKLIIVHHIEKQTPYVIQVFFWKKKH